jgi:hypothetical protein
MRIAYWTPKATNTPLGYVRVILIVFQLQELFHERASMLHYTYIACFVQNDDGLCSLVRKELKCKSLKPLI